ncbi:PGF-CTERM protein [Halogranum amylolyticum]|uniref:PGF-CTERM protein n=1 Tax=Halogranum amylolyticum TaxID=660520 RepID=A0A1H8SN17_9EURY|nr:PGF-CTERM sorting domain-containing protein [Halogranum amylolyticum]SEO79906.1 PGF-CTERM protein [Halogranum amylolyticum]
MYSESFPLAAVVVVLLVASVGTPLFGPVVGDVLARETVESQESQANQTSQESQENQESGPDDPPVEAWIRTYGGPRDDRGALVVRLDDGYLLAASTRSFGQATGSRGDLWLVRLDEEGREQWARPYGTGSDESPRALLVTERGYFLAGEIGTVEGVELYGLDADGAIEWSRLYGVGTGVGDAVLRDDGYLLVGQRITGNGSQPAAVVAVDDVGRFTEIRNYTGRPAAKERFTDVIETTNGTVLVVGESDRSEGDVRAWAVELTPEGEPLWRELIGSPSVEARTTSVVELPDGDYLLVGTQTRNRVAAGWAARLDGTTGTLQWRRSYDEVTVEDVVVDEGGVLLVGSYREGRSATTDALVLALDDRGRERWRQTYGGDGNDVFAAVESTETGHLLVGWTSSTGAGRDDVYAVAVDPSIHARDLATSATTVDSGETIQVSATIVNRGDQRRSHQTTLRVDGDSRETKPVVVPPGEERSVSFELSFEEPGSYAVAVDGLTPISVTVDATPTATPESTPTVTPTATPTPEPTPSPTSAPTTETTSPGFGVVVGVAAVVGVLLLVVLRQPSQSEK